VRFPPLTNATLTRVQQGGGAEDYTNAAAAAGADKWAGSQPVFVSDRAVSEEAADRSSVAVERTIAVDDAVAVAWARGDAVTYTYQGQTQTGEVRDVKTTTAAGLPGVVRLALRDR
jgi:hypothetical protein